MTAQSTPKKRPIILIIAAIMGICILCIAISAILNFTGLLQTDTSTPSQPTAIQSTEAPTATLAEQYQKDYGGSIEAYNEIFTLTDCAALQEKFDIASANNSSAEAGSAEARWTLGYMKAADERMKAVGCY